MTSTYAIKARYYTRQAWIHLGKAREAKRNLIGVTDDRARMWGQDAVNHQAYFARQSMRCATLYRQIDGRL